MSPHVKPLPAIAAGSGPFVVEHCSPDEGGRSAEPSETSAGLFVAPLEAGHFEALAIRQHEYGHLGLVRRGVVPRHTLGFLAAQGFHEYWVQGALDVVVNAYMIAQGNPEIAHLRLWTGDMPTERWLGAATYLRCEGLALAHDARRPLMAACGLTSQDVALLERSALVLWRLGRDARPISVNQLSYLLAELQREFGPDPRESRPRPPATSPGAVKVPLTRTAPTAPVAERPPTVRPRSLADRIRRTLMRRLNSVLSRAEGRALDDSPAAKVPGRRPARRGVPGKPSIVHPGAMRVLHPALPRKAQANRTARRVGPGFSGAFRYPHRALQPAADGRAFGARRHVAGGTVLVDCSGSMSLRADDVARMLEVAPASTVALYASAPDSLMCGHLVIVAAGGCLAQFSELRTWFGVGNVVDIPALEWLCRQRGPRTWVSDGGVTGEGDAESPALDARAATLVRQGRIARRDSISEYLNASRRR